MSELERLLNALSPSHPQAKNDLRRYVQQLQQRLSPVDYNAWQRGYMPPTEHVLIDALSFRGARVRCMSAAGPATIWLVIQTKDGKPLTPESHRALGKQWRAMMELELEILEETPSREAATLNPQESAAPASPTTLEASKRPEGAPTEIQK